MAITITKPTVGGSEDSWGTTINTALDDIVLEINSNADGTNTVTPNLGSGWEVGGVAVTSTAAELNILDGVTATAAEINVLDGDTSASTVTVEGTDKMILNDGGVMKQITVDTLNTYVQGQAASGAFVPSGGIIMWSGAIDALPSGFVLCDGANSTPDLRDRFILGAGNSYNVGATGGANSYTLSSSQLPSHTHSFSGTTASNGDHYHLDGTVMDSGSEATYGSTTDVGATRVDQSQAETKYDHPHTSTAGAHTHTFSGTTGSAGSGSSINNMPAYYALAFIMKT